MWGPRGGAENCYQQLEIPGGPSGQGRGGRGAVRMGSYGGRGGEGPGREGGLLNGGKVRKSLGALER
jgi:hypothetical protein